MAVLLQVLICCLATVAVRSTPLPPINGPCPIVDCLLQEQGLDCPEAQKVRSTFRVNGNKCYGCLICGGPFEEDLPTQAEERGEGSNTSPKPTTTSSTAVAVCPDMDCSDYEDLDCPESEQIRYNYTQDDGTECPGCLECGDGDYVDQDGDGDVGGDGEDDEAEGDIPSPDEGDPPPPAPVLSGGGSSAGRIPGMFPQPCPVVDCGNIGRQDCLEVDKLTSAFSRNGHLCFGCVRCRDGAPKLKPGQPSFEGEPPRCPQLDCSEVEAEMPCALDRRVNSVIDVYGETCAGCRRCLDENEVPVDKDVKTTKMIPKETTTKTTTTTTTTTTNTPVTATEKAESSSKKPQPLVRTLKMPCWLMEMFCRNREILQERQMPAGWLDCNSCQ